MLMTMSLFNVLLKYKGMGTFRSMRFLFKNVPPFDWIGECCAFSGLPVPACVL